MAFFLLESCFGLFPILLDMGKYQFVDPFQIITLEKRDDNVRNCAKYDTVNIGPRRIGFICSYAVAFS